VGDLQFYSSSNLSDWICVFARVSNDEALQEVNIARSRIRFWV